jgi:hypothetical protein
MRTKTTGTGPLILLAVSFLCCQGRIALADDARPGAEGTAHLPATVIERADAFLATATSPEYAARSYVRIEGRFGEIVSSSKDGTTSTYWLEYEYGPLKRIGADPATVTVRVPATPGTHAYGNVVLRDSGGNIVEPRVTRREAVDTVAALNLAHFDRARLRTSLSPPTPHAYRWTWLISIPHPHEDGSSGWVSTAVTVDAVTGEVISRETDYAVE